MMQYRRADVAGGTYFFTVNLAERKKTLLIDHFDKLRTAFNNTKQRHPFYLDALVILPEHLHAMWTLPKDDTDFAKRWMLIKSKFSRQLPKTERINRSRKTKGERGIWQRRYWEHLIRNDFDYQRHVDYIHYNPVKHGYVDTPTDWKYSTIHQHIEAGKTQPNWGVDDNWNETEFGEVVR
ncbi:MAG: transposase [Kangiellaceae bacterium]|nr:transposase [Kangiellaceae bacterium]